MVCLLSAKALRFRVLGIDRISLQSRKKQWKQDEAPDPEFQDAADLQAEAGLDEGSDSQESAGHTKGLRLRMLHVLSLSLSLLNDTSPMIHLNVMMHLRMLQCRMALAQDWTKA